MEAAAPATKRLPARLLAPFSSASMSVSALSIPLTVYLPNYYASHIGLSLATVGAAFSLVRLIDIALDPLIGVAINATNTPFGRFRPWMIAGAPLLMFATYMIFMAVPGVSLAYLVTWLLVLYAGFSMLTLGHSAWAAALVPEYHQRSRVYGWMQAVGVIAIVIVLALPVILAVGWHKTTAQGVQAMGWFIIAVTPLTIGLCLLAVGEPRQSETANRVTLKDYWTMIARPSLLRILAADLFLALGPAITAALYLFFFTQALGFTRTQTTSLLLIYIAAGLVGAPTWAAVARRIGKHWAVVAGCILYGFAQALVFMLPHGNMSLMIPGMFFAGFVVSCFTFLIRAMIADVSDEVRLDIGKDRSALLYGLITSTSKVGSALAVVVTFPIIEYFGFNPKEGVINTGVPLDALIACYVVVPVLTMFVGAYAMWGYKLDANRHDGIRAELATRDAADDIEREAIAGVAGVAGSVGGTAPLLNPGE
ncbi:MAG TPA: MFS transporter [Rhizomicrobium sp.]|nr:MFS transporter [Rhizomicrobium sp.]